ncbi:hypothetical protein [Liquorilactobacillus oeni]|nr:hypothetical protein [Liquorilactobacillus oeni]
MVYDLEPEKAISDYEFAVEGKKGILEELRKEVSKLGKTTY